MGESPRPLEAAVPPTPDLTASTLAASSAPEKARPRFCSTQVRAAPGVGVRLSTRLQHGIRTRANPASSAQAILESPLCQWPCFKSQMSNWKGHPSLI